jgi:hypothetical protein
MTKEKQGARSSKKDILRYEKYVRKDTLRLSVLTLAASGMWAYLGSLAGHIGEAESHSGGGISIVEVKEGRGAKHKVRSQAVQQFYTKYTKFTYHKIFSKCSPAPYRTSAQFVVCPFLAKLRSGCNNNGRKLAMREQSK